MLQQINENVYIIDYFLHIKFIFLFSEFTVFDFSVLVL